MENLFNIQEGDEVLGVKSLEKANKKGTPQYEEWLRKYREKRHHKVEESSSLVQPKSTAKEVLSRNTYLEGLSSENKKHANEIITMAKKAVGDPKDFDFDKIRISHAPKPRNMGPWMSHKGDWDVFYDGYWVYNTGDEALDEKAANQLGWMSEFEKKEGLYTVDSFLKQNNIDFKVNKRGEYKINIPKVNSKIVALDSKGKPLSEQKFIDFIEKQGLYFLDSGETKNSNWYLFG